MIDRTKARQAIDTLAVAISAIMEDSIDIAIRGASDLSGYAAKARTLASAGEDIVRLADAMEVLARHGAKDS